MVLGLLAQTTTDDSKYFFAYMGITAALVFCNLGASYGTAKAGTGVASLSVIKPSNIFRAIIPIVMAGILGIYGIIVAVLLNGLIGQNGFNAQGGYKCFGAGIIVGVSSLAAGLSIGVAGDAGIRAFAQTDEIFVPLLLIMIFSEAIALYGVIVSIIIASSQ